MAVVKHLLTILLVSAAPVALFAGVIGAGVAGGRGLAIGMTVAAVFGLAMTAVIGTLSLVRQRRLGFALSGASLGARQEGSVEYRGGDFEADIRNALESLPAHGLSVNSKGASGSTSSSFWSFGEEVTVTREVHCVNIAVKPSAPFVLVDYGRARCHVRHIKEALSG